MKITIETTVREDIKYQRKVTVEVPYDDQTIDEVIELFSDALQGWGFDKDTIEKGFAEYVEPPPEGK